jgi:hypothetical protein
MVPSSVSPIDQALADRLRRWGLADVAPVMLVALRPLGTVGGQLLTLASPILTTFVAPQRLDEWIELLDDQERLDQLTRLLENAPANNEADQ